MMKISFHSTSLLLTLLAFLSSCRKMDPNEPPVVHITNPTSSILAPIDTVIMVSVDASDDDGVISQVEFEVDGLKVLKVTTKPYEFSFHSSDFGTGTHTIVATATDDRKGTASDSLSIDIVDPRAAFWGDFHFTIIQESWMLGFPTTWDTSFHDGTIKKFELADKADDIYPDDDSWQDPEKKITLNFRPDRNITSIVNLDGTLDPKNGYHYHHEGHYIGHDSITFMITGMGGLGGGWNYFVTGSRR